MAFGNVALMLSSDNAKVGNFAFKKKKPVYDKQPFPLTRKLKDYDDTWNREKVDDYQRVLAKVAVKAWPL